MKKIHTLYRFDKGEIGQDQDPIKEIKPRYNETVMIIDADGKLWGCGWNNHRQLGLPDVPKDSCFTDPYYETPTLSDLSRAKNPNAKIVDVQMEREIVLIKNADGEYLAAGLNFHSLHVGTRDWEDSADTFQFKPVNTPKDTDGNEYEIDEMFMGMDTYLCRAKCGKIFIKGDNCDLAPPYNKRTPSISRRWTIVEKSHDWSECVKLVKERSGKYINYKPAKIDSSKYLDMIETKVLIMKEGGVKVCSSNRFGEIGNGSSEGELNYVEIDYLKDIKFKKSDSNDRFMLFLLSMDGDIYTSGEERYNNLNFIKSKINWFWRKIESKYKFEDVQINKGNIYLKTKCGLEWVDELNKKPIDDILNNI
ncbi:MAG: RCC1-like domain-containing protein [Anaeroplasmataceae bacterium]